MPLGTCRTIYKYERNINNDNNGIIQMLFVWFCASDFAPFSSGFFTPFFHLVPHLQDLSDPRECPGGTIWTMYLVVLAHQPIWCNDDVSGLFELQ